MKNETKNAAEEEYGSVSLLLTRTVRGCVMREGNEGKGRGGTQ